MQFLILFYSDHLVRWRNLSVSVCCFFLMTFVAVLSSAISESANFAEPSAPKLSASFATVESAPKLSASFATVESVPKLSASFATVESVSETGTEVNAVLIRIAKAYKDRTLEVLFDDVAEDAVITWYDGRTYRSKASFLEMQTQLYGGEKSNIRSVTSELTIDDDLVFQGPQSAVATGQIIDQIQLTDGNELPTLGRWTATLAVTDDQWKVVAFQASVDVFENPILAKAKGTLVTSVVLAGVFGVVLGFICGTLIAKQRLLNPSPDSQSSGHDR